MLNSASIKLEEKRIYAEEVDEIMHKGDDTLFDLLVKKIV